MKARETKEEEGANRDAKLGKWRKHTCSGRLIGGPHACSIVVSTIMGLWKYQKQSVSLHVGPLVHMLSHARPSATGSHKIHLR